MPLKSYGVLSGWVVATRQERAVDSPHYQVEVVDDGGTHYRVAVNVESQQFPSELLYYVDTSFHHRVLDALPAPGSGWTALPPGAGRANLDFVRAGLVDRAAMRLLPPDVFGPDNDLADLLHRFLERATGNRGAVVYAFGERWGPEDAVPDAIFGFRPGNGVHDVHMNQGNSPRYRRDDGVWQDGGLLLHFADEARWVAVFLAFQSQSWHTDDVTGHAIDDAERTPVPAATMG
jgi:uncharacterized protein YukJ